MSVSHLAHWPVGLQEVGLEEHIKQVPSDALNSVINGQHVDLLAVLHISALQYNRRSRQHVGWQGGSQTLALLRA